MIEKVAIFTVVILFLLFAFNLDFVVNNTSRDYFIKNSLDEVYSENIVTGIYLDYRLFDSIFEAGILLVSVAGVIFMAKEDKSMVRGENNERK